MKRTISTAHATCRRFDTLALILINNDDDLNVYLPIPRDHVLQEKECCCSERVLFIVFIKQNRRFLAVPFCDRCHFGLRSFVNFNV